MTSFEAIFQTGPLGLTLVADYRRRPPVVSLDELTQSERLEFPRVVVQRILAGKQAEVLGTICGGDQIIKAGSRDVDLSEFRSYDEVLAYIRDSSRPLVLTFYRRPT